MTDSKPTNPKDAIGQTKLPLDLVPESAVAAMCLSFLEGGLKYGRYNWRVKGVRASIYYSAMRRHMMKWWNGEDEDAETLVPHLASVMACCAIIIDSNLCDKLNDDRPPRADVSGYVDGMKANVAHLKELFKDEHPYQYTIDDSGKSDEVPDLGIDVSYQGKFWSDQLVKELLEASKALEPEFLGDGEVV